MKSTATPQGLWAALPTELYRQIFALAYQQALQGHGKFGIRDESALSPGGSFYTLRTVCRKFREVIVQEPLLHRDLYIMSRDTSHNLLRWVVKHHDAIQNVVMTVRNPYLEDVLLALHGAGDHLRAACIHSAIKLTILRLVNFQDLAQISLCSPDADRLSLQGLGYLPKLAKLQLAEGTFTHLDAMSQLTSLQVASAEGECSHEATWVTSVLELHLWAESSLTRFHRTGGLAVCSQLRALTFCDATIDLEHGEGPDFWYNACRVVSAVSTLTALTSLNLGFTDREITLDCIWLTALTGLRSFTGSFKLDSVSIPESVSLLSNLTALELSAWKGRAWLDFNWTAFTLLCTVMLGGDFRLEYGLRGLAALPALEQVRFQYMDRASAGTNQQVAEFKQMVSVESPNVLVEVHAGHHRCKHQFSPRPGSRVT